MLLPVDVAHLLLSEVIEPGDLAVDATMGNGFDTKFLIDLKADVFAFDVQQEAVSATEDMLKQAGVENQAKLILDGHEKLANYVTKPVKGAIFNLGYLPRTDKSIITHAETTIAALEALSDLLLPKGRIALVIYWGHEGGLEEKEAVEAWVKELPQHIWHVFKWAPMNQVNQPAYLIMLEKRR